MGVAMRELPAIWKGRRDKHGRKLYGSRVRSVQTSTEKGENRTAI